MDSDTTLRRRPEWRLSSHAPPQDGEVIGTGFAFTEGPVWLTAQQSVANGIADEAGLFFSDIEADTQYFGSRSKLRIVRTPSGKANGNAIDRLGRLLSCEHDGRRVARLENGRWSTLIESFESARLNSPNDLCVRADGTIYFSDPPYGVASVDRDLSFSGVFRLGAPADATSGAAVIDRSCVKPNGVAIDPDGSALWAADTEAGTVRRYTFGAESEVSDIAIHHGFDRPDGLAFDSAGRLLVAVMAGISVLEPPAAPRAAVEMNERPANLCFGGPAGDELFVCARTTVRRYAWPPARDPLGGARQ